MISKKGTNLKVSILFFLIFCALIVLLLFEVDKRINTDETSWILAFCTIVTAVGGVAAALGIYTQLKESKELNEAQFIVDLNTNFTSNQHIIEIFVLLEKSQKDGENPFNSDHKAKMTMYLTYFELIHYLLNRNILSYKLVNDLFAYRFFLAVHNKHLQEMELVKDASYYRDIFRLHNDWVNYRKTLNEEIMNEEYSLEKVCPIYYELILETM